MRSSALVPVAVIDDHPPFRKGMVQLLREIGGYEVVIVAGNGKQYFDACNGGPHVAIALVDLRMPVMDGYETIERISATSPGTRALALTFERTEENEVRAIHAGACGFLLKDMGDDEIKAALEEVMDTGYYRMDLVLEILRSGYDGRTNQERARSKVLARLSDREIEFLRHVCDPEELTYERIAIEMGVHRRSVDGYREAIFGRFGIKSKVGLVLFAVQWGIVELKEGVV